MKLAALGTPVRVTWLAEQGFRLDPGPYISEAYAARMYLSRVPRTELLSDITERIFNAGRFRREWTTAPEHGVPFLGSADIFEADLSSLPMITRRSYEANSKLPLEPGWTLITCSGMTAGRVTYARLSMRGHACSQDVMRVVPNRGRISAGYLYAFLASSFGVPMIKGGIYGTSVRHIEAQHLSDIPVPRFDDRVEARIDALISEAMHLRQQYEEGISFATKDLFDSAGLSKLLDLRWHEQSRDIDFAVSDIGLHSLRALNYAPRARQLLDVFRAVPHRTLASICARGRLERGARFKRVDSNPEHGVQLINQRRGFWLRPQGRWISLPKELRSEVMVEDETVLIAATGTLGDREVFCRPIFVTGSWLRNAYTDHFVRVVSGDSSYPGAYLFAYLRSEPVFRMLRSMGAGGKQQDIHPQLRAQLPVPECTVADRERIAETVRQAYRDRDEADRKEDQAFALLDDAVREAAR